MTVPVDKRIPESLWRELEALAALPRCPHRALQRLALAYDRSPHTLAEMIWELRQGLRPNYRRSVA